MKTRPPAVASFGLSRLGWFAFWAIILSVCFAPSLLQVMRRAPDRHYEALGYTRLINQLIARRGWLRLDASGESPRIAFSDLAPAEASELIAFARDSYLGADMGRADPAIWEVDDTGRVLGVRPEAHRLAGPFSGEDAWRGDILYRDGRRTAFELVAADGGTVVLDPARMGEGPLRLSLDGSAGSGGAAQRVVLAVGDRPAVLIMLVGDRVMVQANHVPGVAVAVGARALEPSPTAPAIDVLRPLETLTVAHGERTRRYLLRLRETAVSRFVAGRGRVRTPGLAALAEGAERAMRDPGSGALVLTLDAGIQAAAEAALTGESERLRRGGAAFPAAAVVMDASNGELLALASYPYAPEHLEPSSRTSLRPDPLLALNHNFRLMPVGSVAKAPLAWAILADAAERGGPDLSTLTISPAGLRPSPDHPGRMERSFRNLLGVDLGMDITDHVTTDPIDFTAFLARSSNKYAAALMLMAMTPDGAHDESPDCVGETCYGLGGRRYAGPPAARVFAGSGGPEGVEPALGQDLSLTWPRRLGRMFDMRLEGDRSREALAWDAGLWGGRLDPRRAADVSPEYENFGFSDITDIGADYVMTILGGSRGRWTTIKMAEAFARIATRRPVHAQLTLQAGPSEEGRLPGGRPWEALIAGLRAVTDPSAGGTGAALRGYLPEPAGEGIEVRIFAKTGTPNLDRFVSRTRANAALDRYARRRCALIYRRLVGLTVADDVPVEREALTRAVERQGAACHDGRPGLVVEEILRLNRRASGGRIEGLSVQGSQVTGVPIHAVEVPTTGHAVALVVALYEAGAPDDAPIRALSVVVNIQERRTDQAPAVGAAGRILCDPAVVAWLLRGQGRRGGACRG